MSTPEIPSPSVASATQTLAADTAPAGWHPDPQRRGQLRYCVPVLSWWRPVQIVRDLWWAATPEPDRAKDLPGERPIPWPIVGWWASWLSMNLLGWASLQATLSADELQGLFTAFLLDAVSDGITVVSALLAIAVLGGILRKLQRVSRP